MFSAPLRVFRSARRLTTWGIQAKPGIIKRILNALERFIARIRGKDAYLAVEQRDMLTGELKRAYGTDVKGEAAVESGEGKRHSLAGANSRTADLNSLGGAYQMYQNGVSMDTIRKRTGWWQQIR